MENILKKASGIFLASVITPNTIVIFKTNWVENEVKRLKVLKPNDQILIKSGLVNCENWKKSGFLYRLINLPTTK